MYVRDSSTSTLKQSALRRPPGASRMHSCCALQLCHQERRIRQARQRKCLIRGSEGSGSAPSRRARSRRRHPAAAPAPLPGGWWETPAQTLHLWPPRRLPTAAMQRLLGTVRLHLPLPERCRPPHQRPTWPRAHAKPKEDRHLDSNSSSGILGRWTATPCALKTCVDKRLQRWAGE